MQINSLELKNFRNHVNLTLDLNRDNTVIMGQNGCGKTNILEAVYMLSTAKSPRAKYDVDLIAHNESYSTVVGKISSDIDDFILELQIKRLNDNSNRSSKKVKVNKLAKRINDFTGHFNSVLFTPEDIQLLTRSPSFRRRYLNEALTQIDTKYKNNLSDYTKAVRQRNKLLEEMLNFPQLGKQLSYWTNILLVKGRYIQMERDKYISSLEKSLMENKALFSENHVDIKIKYNKSEITNESIKEYKDREIYAGRTLIGPHRDDFAVFIDGYDIAEFGSRGQQRSIVLGLKIAEMDFINFQIGERPVLLLDDIFSELDEPHQKTVLDILPKQQNIITTAEKHSYLDELYTLKL